MTDHHQSYAYQKAKLVTKQVFLIQPRLPKNYSSETIFKQILRSSSSVGANIAEGFGRNNRKEFKQFLGIARGSSLETEYWLELISDLYNLQLSDIINLNKEVIRLLNATIKSLGAD